MTRRIASVAVAAVTVLFVFATLAAACGGSYCGYYSDWRRAERDANRAEAANNIGDLRKAMDRRSSAAKKIWDAAPPGYTWADIRREC
ncbi:MAG: hypothetical protein OXI26_06225 [bacterium]|nr:hypothetical protein [bacterium]